MTAVAYFAGLRPSEVVMLRASSLWLPTSGWGRIAVTEADVRNDEAGEPKTGSQSVPIPPVLVADLAAWVQNLAPEPDQLLFRSRTGKMPTLSNWLRAWHRALGASAWLTQNLELACAGGLRVAGSASTGLAYASAGATAVDAYCRYGRRTDGDVWVCDRGSRRTWAPRLSPLDPAPERRLTGSSLCRGDQRLSVSLERN